MPTPPPPRKRSFWRVLTRFFGRIWGNPLPTLAVVVLIIAGINYKTLMAGLPNSLPELTAWWVGRDPVEATINGSVTGTELCWQMRFTFLDRAGQPILEDTDYTARVGTTTPSRAFTLPALDSYVVRVAVELTNADPDRTCIALAGIAVLRAKTYDVEMTDFAESPTIDNRCSTTDVGLDCTIEIR